MTEREASRAQSIARVRDELTTVTRREAARARPAPPGLSTVDRSLLGYIEGNPGCRAVEIAAHFQLNKSTVSRQLKHLIGLGLVTARPDASPGLSLELTAAGRSLQADAASDLLATLTTRLAAWSNEELEHFAALLGRFNAS